MDKNDNIVSGVGVLIIVGLILWGIYSLLGWGEREGVVSYEDCRQIINLPSDTWEKYYHTFTCSYRKTQSGLIMDGMCVRIENDRSLFSTSHTCATAYIYEKKQEGNCKDPQYPYMGYDDKCYTVPQ